MKPNNSPTADPLLARDNKLQDETFSPKIPALEKRAPNFIPTVKQGAVGKIIHPHSTDTASFDMPQDLSETNLHDKFVSNQAPNID